ncbi:hypothetical protein GCM10009001_00720 [Virgibacillus siamensis]|uniref:Uncharacterized protein n=1 Tax=Virgibacillus siamensis TaxID=480071 RepID=A0ABN1FDR5_9BACI
MIHNDPLVEKEVKRHKKFLESFTINPGSFQINNDEYFFANYYRWNKMNGCAVVSPTSKAEKKVYLDAFDTLLEFAELFHLILTHAGERANTDMQAFTTMREFLSDVLNGADFYLTEEGKNVFEYCLKGTELILNLQERIIKIYQNTEQKIKMYQDGTLINFSKNDLEELANYLGEVDYIQYRQLVADYESIPKYKYIKEMENSPVGEYITPAVKRYLEEFSKNESGQRKRIEHISFQPNMEGLTKKEHIEGAKKAFYNSLAETNASSRKQLRI